MIGNPLVAWRDDQTLQIGWGEHAVIVESAPRSLPTWLTTLNGEHTEAWLVEHGRRLGIAEEDLDALLARLAQTGLTTQLPQLRVSIASPGLVHEPLAKALTLAGVHVVRQADVVVFPQGQVPSMVTAPAAPRLIPVWFSASAVHVGPVLDEAAGPCPRCVDLTWADHDRCWPQLVAQSGTLGLWGHPAHLVQAAAAISLLGPSERTIGLEMISDIGNPGPRWRVWAAHPRCNCRQT